VLIGGEMSFAVLGGLGVLAVQKKETRLAAGEGGATMKRGDKR
jgi:hypothetical protein